MEQGASTGYTRGSLTGLIEMALFCTIKSMIARNVLSCQEHFLCHICKSYMSTYYNKYQGVNTLGPTYYEFAYYEHPTTMSGFFSLK